MYVVQIEPILHDGQWYRDGETIPLTDAQAAPLLQVKAIALFPEGTPVSPSNFQSGGNLQSDATLDGQTVLFEELLESEPEPETSPVGDKINLNQASTEQLLTLKYVGPVSAQKIEAGRPFESLDQVRELLNLSPDKWAEIEGTVTL